MKCTRIAKPSKQIKKCLPQLRRSRTRRPRMRSRSSRLLPVTFLTALPTKPAACSRRMTMDGPSGMGAVPRPASAAGARVQGRAQGRVAAHQIAPAYFLTVAPTLLDQLQAFAVDGERVGLV